MKVTIELDLDDPEHKQAVDVLLNWGEFYTSMWELSSNFSGNFKHKDWTDDQWLVFNEVKDWLMTNFEKPLQIVQE